MSSRENWQNIYKKARNSLKQGKPAEARRLARQVVSLAPEQEAPWLLLAATAKPRASIGYLKQALALNPNSRRAKQGLRWARKQIKQNPEMAISSSANRNQVGSLAMPQTSNYIFLAAAALAISFALLAWLRPPTVDKGLKMLGGAAAQQVNALFATQTSSPTSTPIASATATSSPTASPTETSSPTATATATPVTPTNTAVATNGPEADEAQKKFKAEIPSYVGDEERWIDINLSTQTLTAFEGNQVMRNFTVSTGRGATPTVVGEFRVWVKVRIQDMSGPGYYLSDVPYVMYFFEDYGIHGTYWHSNFGTPMSAGCVNMTIDDSNWMYQFASVGTLVKVHY